jgi:molybdate transport system substrate-binding protein
MRHPLIRAALATAMALLLAGCGSSSPSATSPVAGSPADSTKLTILAAASLTKVLPQIGAAFSQGHTGITFTYSFAGTDQLAAQIEQGAPADVFAGASTKYGDQLSDGGQIDPYTVFCTNQLVLITPASNPAGIGSLEDLSTKPAKLVIGSETVPVGTYTRTVLANLEAVYGAGYAGKVLANVVSNEDSVTSIVAKVVSGEADAGFVYITDALGAGSKVNTITLPAEAQAVAKYPAAAVSASAHAAEAKQFVDYLLTAPAQALLRRAGFGPPPSP